MGPSIASQDARQQRAGEFYIECRNDETRQTSCHSELDGLPALVCSTGGEQGNLFSIFGTVGSVVETFEEYRKRQRQGC